MNYYDLPGASAEYVMDGYSDDIKSNKIISFEYTNPDFYVMAKLENDKIGVISRGGNGDKRDGSRFKLRYSCRNTDFLVKLQDILDKYRVSKNNGYVCEVNGLPDGLGDTVSVLYESGEKIYKSSNQGLTLSDEAIAAIYDSFRNLAVDNGFDFTTSGSNEMVYDDASSDFLQGQWKGTHFGDDIRVSFDGDNVKIYVNDELTDDTNYVIFEGWIMTDKLKGDIHEAKSHYDYEGFKGISSMKKKNDILLTAYFSDGGYSTCDLLTQRKG